MKTTIEIELTPFDVPDYVRQKATEGRRQNGITFGSQWALQDLDVEILSRLCDEFRAAVFKKAGKRDTVERCVERPTDPERFEKV